MNTPPDPDQSKRLFSDGFYKDEPPSNSGGMEPPPPPPRKKLGTVALVFFILLTIPTVFLMLMGLVFVFTNQAILPLLLFIIAFLLVFPPLQRIYPEKFPILQFRYLNMFLAVVFMFSGLVALGGSLGDETASNDSPTPKPSEPAIALNDVQICKDLVENTCDGDYNLFTRDIGELFIVGNPVNFTEDLPVTLEVEYQSQPQKTEVIKNETFVNPVGEDGTVQIKYTPETLPVGAYTVTLTSETDGFEAVEKTFQVWPSGDWVTAIADETKPEVDTEIQALNLCIDTKPEEIPDEQTRADLGDRCGKSLDTFDSSVTALKVDADLEDAKDGVQLTFQWFYQNDDGSWREINSNTVDLEFGLNGFIFTLQGDFPPGEYEVLAMLEAHNRPPLRRPFTITKAE